MRNYESMAVKYQIIYWRDIPAQIKLRAGRQRLSRPLDQRFQVAIDEAAMRAGKTESEEYLDEWRAGDWQDRTGETEEVAAALVAQLESDYSVRRLQQLVRQKGWQDDVPTA
jgi:hypothetical protein